MAQAQSITPLPKQAIEEDHRLEKAAAGSATALIKHRWHWTLDESNAKRVSLRQYARDVGVAFSRITKDANAYVLMSTHAYSPDEARERASMSEEKHEAVRAVAAARGIATRTARERHADEVRQVRTVARERAETKGTTTAEEARKVAEWNAKVDHAREREREEKRARHGMQYVRVEGKLQDAKRKVVEAIDGAIGAEFDREERDLLLQTIGEVQEGLQLARTAIAGKAVAEKKLEVLRGGLSA